MAAGFTQKEWKDRITEFPTRRQLAVVSETGSGMTVDVTRAEGLVSQEGDAYSAANMNGMEQRVKAAFDNVDTDVAGANSAVSGLTTRMGNAESNISGLTTRMGTAESNISGLGTRMGSAESNITKISGDLASAKANFQAGCSTIAAAITAMGVPTANNATPAIMANNIKAIKNAASGSYANAASSTAQTVTCGFKPSAIMVMGTDPNRRSFMLFDSSISPDHVYVGYSNGGVSYYSFSGYDESHEVDHSKMFTMSLTNTGFILKNTMNSDTVHWFAYK